MLPAPRLKYCFLQDRRTMKIIKKDVVLETLLMRQKKLKKRCQHLRQVLKEAPSGNLRVATKKGKAGLPRYQYYLLTKPGDTKGTYLKKSELSIAAAIAQRDYQEDLLAEQQRELCFVERTLSSYMSDCAEKVLETLHPGRRCLVKSAIISDVQYVDSWLNRQYKQNPFPEAPRFQTASGIMVRSKSEMIIADLLYEAGIPFYYEFSFKLKKDTLYYPDFYCLNPHTRSEFIWEHFGRMDDVAYCKRTVRKIADYQQYLPEGCGLVMSFEDGETQFTKQQAEAALKRFGIVLEMNGD